MTADEQLQLWLKGHRVHDDDNGECCPDFSCCQPQLLAPIEVRQLFIAARKAGNETVTYWLLAEFLTRAISALPTKTKVYIAGLEEARGEF